MAENATPTPKRIGILGGTGFVGRALQLRLLKDRHSVKVLTRDAKPHALAAAEPYVEMAEGDPYDDDFLRRALADCEVAINLVGILNEQGHAGGREFHKVHAELPRRFAAICRELGIQQALHMSSLGASAGSAPSLYLRSKGEGSNALRVELGDALPWTIFCPSVIFGEGDSFTNRFADLMKIAPGFFPLACPDSRMAPVHIADVVEAFARCVGNPEAHGMQFQICGPREYSLQELVRYISRTSGRRRAIVGLPDWLSKIQASILEFIPGKPFSRDNYRSLQIDSIAEPGKPGLLELGIAPTPIEDIAPGYLAGPKA